MTDELEEKLSEVKNKYKSGNNGNDMPDEEAKEHKSILKKEMKEYILSMAVIKRADENRYGSLQKGLRNDYLLGNDRYPTTIPETLKLLDNYKDPNPTTNQNRNVNRGGGNAGASFLQTTNGLKVEFLRGADNSFSPDTECYKCKCFGHISSVCPVAKDSAGGMLPGGVRSNNRTRGGRGGRGGRGNGPGGRGNGSDNAGRWTLIDRGGGANRNGSGGAGAEGTDENAATVEEVSLKNRCGILMNQHNISHINPNWILLDSESTDHIFCNAQFLTDVKTTTDGEM